MCSEPDVDIRAGNRWSGGVVAPGLEWAAADFPEHQFTPHRHDGYVVGVTGTGVQRFTYRGAERLSLPGEVFLLHPDERHDGRPGTKAGFGFRAVYLSPDHVLAALDQSALPFSPEPVHDAQAVSELVLSVFDVWSGGEPDDLAVNDAVCLMADLFQRVSDQRGAPGLARRGKRIDPLIRRVREDLMSVTDAPVMIRDLERRHGLDRFTLSRDFRRAFGVTPSRFILLRRLDRARVMLRQGQSLADVAVTAGFADQSHMTRHFRATYGLTPGRWRDMQVS
ncbi:MAG: AraC family transcriptional regulator [Minwuia thermotolerans]|nr:MAG: AraC family transcriptional regulator [Minwuia thermotolerans]